jgi:hypothetical protein
MSAVVFIDVTEAGAEADRVVASLKRSVPASFVGVAGTERIEVFFSGPSIDEDQARQSLEEAIAASGDGAASLVSVVYN